MSVARAARLPEINAALSVSCIGDGFTTARDFSERQKAPVPHLGDGFSVTLSQPLYTGGAISSGIELAELKSTAARYAAVTRQQYDGARTEYEARKARYEMLARQRTASTTAVAVSRERKTQSEAGIELAEALLETARLNLSYTVITAPCDGVTSRREIQVGQLRVGCYRRAALAASAGQLGRKLREGTPACARAHRVRRVEQCRRHCASVRRHERGM